MKESNEPEIVDGEVTKMKKVSKWEKMPLSFTPFGVRGGNWLLNGKGYYISYQDFTEGGRSDMFESLSVIFTGDTRADDETALYDSKVWRILWGDHRKEYELVFDKGVKACIKLYDKLKPEFGCDKWSTDDD